jgi:hypothetical protein
MSGNVPATTAGPATTTSVQLGATKGELSQALLDEAAKLGGDQAARIRAAQGRK